MGDEGREPRFIPRPDDRSEVDHRDAKLVLGMLAGDADALRSLIEYYDRLVRYTVHQRLGDDCRRDPTLLDERASVVWSGFVESIRTRGAGPDGSVAAYLVRITRNKCADHLRARARRTSLSGADVDIEPDQLVDDSANPLDTLLDLEKAQAMRSCIADLSDADRNLFSEMELILSRRWGEAANRLGIPESTLRSRWEKVIGLVRQCMAKKIEKK
jgi:RNA polymerase sigma factor (sigma-70 family)